MIRILHQRLTTYFATWARRFRRLLMPILLCKYYLIGCNYFTQAGLLVAGTFPRLVTR